MNGYPHNSYKNECKLCMYKSTSLHRRTQSMSLYGHSWLFQFSTKMCVLFIYAVHYSVWDDMYWSHVKLYTVQYTVWRFTENDLNIFLLLVFSARLWIIRYCLIWCLTHHHRCHHEEQQSVLWLVYSGYGKNALF